MYEKIENYIWALRDMNEAIQIETKPQVIITNNEDELTKAIEIPSQIRNINSIYGTLRRKYLRKFPRILVGMKAQRVIR